MEVVFNLLLIAAGFMSFVPVIQLLRTSKDMKYRCLKFLVNATFVWSVLIFVERFVSNVNIVYYAHNELKEMARIGGDEFLIVMENTSLEELEKIRKTLLDNCFSEDIEEKISVSIGLGYTDESSSNVYKLIQEADKDMYAMKKLSSKAYSMEIVKYATNKDTYIR